MIERIVRFSIQQPALVLGLTLLFAIFGLRALMHLPIDAVPDITNNQVQINAIAEGIGAEGVEKQVTFPIENALSGIPGLSETRSLSRYGFSQVTAIFDDDVPLYFARQQINERLSAAASELPSGVEVTMGPISTGLSEVYMWTIEYAPFTPSQGALKKVGWQPDGSYRTFHGERLDSAIALAGYLRTVQDAIVAPQLKGIPGLAGVDAIGGHVKQYQVEVDAKKLQALQLTLKDIQHALEENNLALGAGYLVQNGEAYLVQGNAKIQTIEQIEQVIVAHRGATAVPLKEVADVRVGAPMRFGAGTENGKEVVIGTAMMLIGANSRDVAQSVHERLEVIQKSLPPDVILKPVLNRMKLIDATIQTVLQNLVEGALLVMVVLFAFLGHMRAALITAAVIPLSMLLTAMGMVQLKMSGNLMSLGALDFGLIVDGAVIITENALRHFAEKQKQFGRKLTREERLEELTHSACEMLRPSLFGQAIIMMVYLPLLTLSGIEGKMFTPMALTVLFALGSALLLSLTMVPAALALALSGPIAEKENRCVLFIKQLYTPILKKAMQFPFRTLSGSIVALLVAGLLFMRLGSEFIPELDELDLAIQAKRIPGTSLEQSVAMQQEVEKRIASFPEVQHVYSKTGTAEMASDPMPPEDSDTFVILRPKEQWPAPSESKSSLVERIMANLSELPGNAYECSQPIQMRCNELIAGVKSDVAVKLYGEDFPTMERVAHEIAKALRQVKGAAEVMVDPVEGLPLIDIQLKRPIMQRLGLTASDVLQHVHAALVGIKAGVLQEGDRHYDIVVRLPETARNDLETLSQLNIPLPGPSAEGKVVPLHQVAAIELKEGLYEISRENGKRMLAVSSNVRGNDLGHFIESAKKQIQQHVQLPPGYWIEWGGQYENLLSAKERLMWVVPVCFAMILLLLCTALSSFALALIVFTGIPFALTGGIFALWVRDMPFSISSAVGCIALSGIAVLNGLVLISAMQQERLKGKDVDAAIYDGALARVRPVFMTALVASLGFLPMALATGAGAEVQKPIATVVIGGLISSTLLTLVVLPVLYRFTQGQGEGAFSLGMLRRMRRRLRFNAEPQSRRAAEEDKERKSQTI